MKRTIPFLSALLLVGCGPFTNVPAQLHVKSVVPATVTVTYTKDSSSNATATFTNPLITFEGEPGSPGAVFTRGSVTYLNEKGETITSDPAPFSFECHIDIGTSNYRDADDPKKILLGSATWTAPIINQAVIDYGNKGTASTLTAVVGLAGKDYSWFPITREISIPIAFAGQAN